MYIPSTGHGPKLQLRSGQHGNQDGRAGMMTAVFLRQSPGGSFISHYFYYYPDMHDKYRS